MAIWEWLTQDIDWAEAIMHENYNPGAYLPHKSYPTIKGKLLKLFRQTLLTIYLILVVCLFGLILGAAYYLVKVLIFC